MIAHHAGLILAEKLPVKRRVLGIVSGKAHVNIARLHALYQLLTRHGEYLHINIGVQCGVLLQDRRQDMPDE